jgi:ABC-type maltose transport system permease subunit
MFIVALYKQIIDWLGLMDSSYHLVLIYINTIKSTILNFVKKHPTKLPT